MLIMSQLQSSLHNVAILNTGMVNGHIISFINNKANRSMNTAEAYDKDIRLFFKLVKNKNIEQLEIVDVKVKLSDLLDYQTLLKDSNKYKNNTINRMIASVKSLYSFLKANEYDVNPFIFKEVKELSDDTKTIGFISPDEVKYIAELALDEKHNGIQKKALILLAASTSIRKDAVLNIRYGHIIKHENKNNVYVIGSSELFDKGKMVQGKEIHKDIYDMLISFQGNKQHSDLVFDVSPTAIDTMIKRLCIKAGFDPNRNISWHSLRKAGVMWTDEATNGDIIAITAQGGWSSPTVAYKSYIDKKRKVNLAGEGMFENVDETVFDELSRDEMLTLLKGFGNGFGTQLRRKAQELVDGRQ